MPVSKKNKIGNLIKFDRKKDWPVMITVLCRVRWRGGGGTHKVLLGAQT